MTEYNGEARALGWPLINPLVYSSTTEEDTDCEVSSFVWPEDSDERVPILFNLSLNEYVALSSTIDVGSDVAYGTDAIRIMWLWLRNMRCPVSWCSEMIKVLNECEEFRDELTAFIQNAINNVSTVQNAIIEVVLASDTVDDFIESTVSHGSLEPAQRAQNMLNGSCDLGYLYNQVVTSTDVLKTLKNNLFSAIYTGSSPLEYAQALYSVSSVFAAVFPSSMVMGFVAGALATAGTAYDSAIAGGIEDEINCFLLDKIQCNCEMSIDRLIELYKRKSGLYIPDDPWEAFQYVANILITGGLSDDQWFYAINMMLLTAIRLSVNLLGIDFSQYALVITASGDTSNDDYLTDCTSLGDPCDCENPANFFIGNVIEQEGLTYTIESAGSNVIAWGQIADGGPICYLDHIEAVSGNLTTGDLFLADGTPATFDALPAYIRYLAIGSFLGPMTYKYVFLE